MSATGRPRKACGQCNSQKVRCSGDKPTCQRCLRLSRTCIYPSSVIQDLLPIQSSGNGSGGQSVVRPNRRESNGLLPSPLSSISEKSYVGIPATLVNALVEVYFSYIYNAHLLLHKRTFEQALAAGNVRPHVVLSVCAFAANFYRDGLDSISLREHGFGYEWAERAGKLVFQDIEDPNEENVVTFINLALFWYSQGSWRRSFIHKGNGVQTAHLLGLSYERPGKEKSLASEISRRRFWACYLINAFASESPFLKDPSPNVLHLTLPWPDEDFENGRSSERVFLDSRRGNGSLYGELARALRLWTAVHTLIKTPDTNVNTRITALNDLDARLNQWWSNIPTSFTLTPSTLRRTPGTMLPRLLLIHIVYHQCLCALHSSIVPLFSWSEGDDNLAYARQVSAQIAFEHANIMSSLFEACLLNYSDWAKIPSFIGYAAYCSSAIQIPFMWCSKNDVRESAYANVRTNLKMIHSLGRYWKFIALLGIHVRHLYEMHAKNPVFLDNEPKYLHPDKLKGYRVAAHRARTSILSHNDILWNKSDGSYAKPGDDLSDLNAQDEEPPPEVPEVTPEGPEISMQEGDSLTTAGLLYDGMPIDYFQPFLDPEIFNSEATFLNFDQMNTSQYNDQFDIWLGGNLSSQMSGTVEG